MLIKTEIDVSAALGTLDLILKKLPYVTNNALARTARELVDFEKTDLAKIFQERTQFIPNRVQVLKWPKANDLWARVGINANVQGGAALLPTFEEGGMKEPAAGREIAVAPTGGAVRPDFAKTQTPSLKYKALQISAVGSQFKGQKRTFVIPGVGVFQRLSSRQRSARQKRGTAVALQFSLFDKRDPNITLLYKFEAAVPLPQKMNFVESARKFVLRRYPEIWKEEFVKEMATRKR